MTLSKAYELESFIQRSEGPFLEVLFSGGVFRHNRLRTGAIWEVSWSNRRANDREREERMRQVKETVFLFKFLFPKKISFPCERHSPYIKELKGDDPTYKFPEARRSNNNFRDRKPDNLSDFNSSDSPDVNAPKMKPSVNIPPLMWKNKIPGLDLEKAHLQNGVDKKVFAVSFKSPGSEEEEDESEGYDNFDESPLPKMRNGVGSGMGMVAPLNLSKFRALCGYDEAHLSILLGTLRP